MGKNDSKSKLSKLTLEELQGKLKVVNSLQITTLGIFAFIILAWIVLGYWKENVPVFISTIAVAVAASSGLIASRSSLNAEIAKRKNSAPDDQ